MEYLRVNFPVVRAVFVDGDECGRTNQLIRLDPGTHLIDLGDPPDYRPREQRHLVQGTTADRPLVVDFES